MPVWGGLTVGFSPNREMVLRYLVLPPAGDFLNEQKVTKNSLRTKVLRTPLFLTETWKSGRLSSGLCTSDADLTCVPASTTALQRAAVVVVFVGSSIVLQNLMVRGAFDRRLYTGDADLGRLLRLRRASR